MGSTNTIDSLGSMITNSPSMVNGYLVSNAGDGVSTVVTVCETLTKDAPGSLQYCSVSFFLKKRERDLIYLFLQLGYFQDTSIVMRDMW